MFWNMQTQGCQSVRSFRKYLNPVSEYLCATWLDNVGSNFILLGQVLIKCGHHWQFSLAGLGWGVGGMATGRLSEQRRDLDICPAFSFSFSLSISHGGYVLEWRGGWSIGGRGAGGINWWQNALVTARIRLDEHWDEGNGSEEGRMGWILEQFLRWNQEMSDWLGRGQIQFRKRGIWGKECLCLR